MSPHFLCNQLNDVSYLVTEYPDKSVKHLNKLARFYRNVMEYIKLPTIELSKEIEFVKDYIELNYLKEKDRYTIKTDYIADDSTKVPTMVIQPLVENAVKHGMCNCFENGLITVTVKMEDSLLLMSVKDNGAGISNKQLNKLYKPGHALHNIKQRLELIYNKAVKLNVDSKLNKSFNFIIEITCENISATENSVKFI